MNSSIIYVLSRLWFGVRERLFLNLIYRLFGASYLPTASLAKKVIQSLSFQMALEHEYLKPSMARTLTAFVFIRFCVSGTRNVVAECMGKLALLEPTDLLPNLQSQLKAENPLIRSTVVTAIKFTILDQVEKGVCLV